MVSAICRVRRSCTCKRRAKTSTSRGILLRPTQAAADGRVLTSVQNPLRLDAYNEPEPDFLLLRPRADDYQASHPAPRMSSSLLKSPNSSLAYDRGRKLALYAKFKVPEVWIIDIAGSSVEIYRQPQDGAYSSVERRSSGMLAPGLVPGVAINVAALLA